MLQAVILVSLLFVIAQIHRSAGSVIALTLSTESGLSPREIGTIMGVMPLASALVQIPSGIALDRFGVRNALSAAALLACLGTILFAVADTVAGLIAGRVMIGMGLSASLSSMYLIALAWTSPERMAVVAGTAVAVAGTVGAVAATTPLLAAFQLFGWTNTFFALAVLTAFLAMLIRWLVKDDPYGRADLKLETLGESLRGLREIMGDRDLQRAFVMAFCFAGPFAAVGGLWAGPYFRDLYGMSHSEASGVILAMMVAYNGGAFIYGQLDRMFATRKWIVLGGVAVMIAGHLILSVWPAPRFWVTVSILIVISLAGPFFITLAAQCRSFVSASRSGRTITTMSLAGIFGIFVMQWVTGLTIDAYTDAGGTVTATGYRLVFAIPAAFLIFCAAIYFPIRDNRGGDHGAGVDR